MRKTAYSGRTAWQIIGAFCLVALAVHLLTASRYGYFRDELYYVACSRHLAAGYVDLAPLSAWLLRIEMTIFGDSLLALRLLPALAGAATIALTGAIARELRGGLWAVAIGCAASASALVYLALGNFYSMNALEPLFWMGCVYVLIRLINGGSGWLWLWFGAIAGLGVENKHSLVFFAGGLVAALVLTSERRHFAQLWIWLGGMVAFVLALPNLLWQMKHGWPTYELLQNIAHSDKNVVVGPLAFIGQQITILNPATFPVWLGGLIWLLFAKAGHAYRSLGIAYLITLAEFIIMHGKHYYLAPIYPVLFAAGGVAVEQVFAIRLRWLKPVIICVMIAFAALLAPTIIPVLKPEQLVGYMRTIHFEPPRTETGHNAVLPQLFADQFGWEEMVRSIADAYQRLSPEDQKRAGIFCQDYGQAGAVDFFGKRYGLPPALSGHQNYFFWGPHGYTGELLLVLDSANGKEAEEFEMVEDLGLAATSPWAMPFEQRTHLYLCRNLKGDLRELWPELKKWR